MKKLCRWNSDEIITNEGGSDSDRCTTLRQASNVIEWQKQKETIVGCCLARVNVT